MTLIGEVPPGLAATAARIGDAATVLDEDQVTAFVQEQLAAHPFDGRSVCVLVPDATRTCPLPLLLRAVHGALHGRVSRLTVLVALGTHAPMGEEALAAHLGYAPGRLDGDLSGHHGRQPRVVEARRRSPTSARSRPPGSSSCPRAGWTWRCRCCSTARSSSTTSRWCSARCCRTRSSGSPAATSTSSPASRGQKIIDVSHWLGALITSAEIIGTTGITPVRALIDDGAALIPSEKLAFCAVTAEVADGAVDGAVDAAVPRRRGPAGCTRCRSATPRASWANAARGVRGDPRDLPGRTGPPGALDRSRDVRRDLDRRQGLLQAGAGGRRRRRGDPLRPAHHARSPPRTRRSTTSATTAATTS